MRALKIILAGTCLIPAYAAAQTADGGVVVMRRQLAPPKISTPTPSPTGTPTPTPSGTPTPTPTPTPPAEVFSWTVTGHGPWASGCSETTTRPTLAECRGSVQGVVSPDKCDPAQKPADQPGSNLASCSYYWTTPAFGSDYTPTCSTSSTRQITSPAHCMRTDGVDHTKDVDLGPNDSRCDPAGKVTADTPVAYYLGCTMSWKYEDWTYASNCSKSTTGTRTASCRGTSQTSDVYTIADSYCDGVQKDSLTIANAKVHQGCQHKWVYSAWTPTPPANTCATAYPQTRTATCVAVFSQTAGDTETVPDAFCDASQKEALSQNINVQTGCNLLTNGDFQAANGWTMAGNGGTATYGNTGANRYGLLIDNYSMPTITQSVTLPANKNYTLTYEAWVGGYGYSVTPALQIRNPAGTVIKTGTTVTQLSARTFTVDFSTTAAGAYKITFVTAGGNEVLFVDNVKLNDR